MIQDDENTQTFEPDPQDDGGDPAFRPEDGLPEDEEGAEDTVRRFAPLAAIGGLLGGLAGLLGIFGRLGGLGGLLAGLSRRAPVRPFARRSVSPPAMAGVVLALAVVGVLAWLALGGDGKDAGEGTEEVELALVDSEAGADTGDSGMESDETAADQTVEPEEPAPAPAEDPHAGDEDVAIDVTPDLEEEALASVSPTETAPETTREPATESVSPADVSRVPEPETERRIALARPDPALMQQTTRGPLPIVAADGREPWQVYKRPSAASPGQPQLAIIIVGLGLSSAAVDSAIALPGDVTLSFTPYAPKLGDVVARAREEGHEVLLDLPMEPVSYPADDPGPHTLLTSLNPTDNIARLEWLLGRFVGYVGVITHMGSRFTTSPESLRPVMTALRDRGLMFVDSQATNKSVAGNVAQQLSLPHTANLVFLDHEPTRAAIDRTFADLEAAVLQSGEAVAVARSFPVTLERMAAWLPALEERGIALVPASALATQP